MARKFIPTLNPSEMMLTVKPLFVRHGALFFNHSPVVAFIRGDVQFEGGTLFFDQLVRISGKYNLIL